MAKQYDLISSAIKKILDASIENKDLKLTIDDFTDLYREFRNLQDKATKRKQKIHEIVISIHEKRSRTK